LLLAVFILVLLNFYQTESTFIVSSDSENESNSAKTPHKKKTKYLCVFTSENGKKNIHS
jgi:hypothetical protein